MMPGFSATFKISRMTEGFIFAARAAICQMDLSAEVVMGFLFKQQIKKQDSVHRHFFADEYGGNDRQAKPKRKRVQRLAQERHGEQQA